MVIVYGSSRNIVAPKGHIVYAEGITSFAAGNIVYAEGVTSFCVRKPNDVGLATK